MLDAAMIPIFQEKGSREETCVRQNPYNPV